MAGPFDFLQGAASNVEQNFNDFGGWLKGLLPSQPAQPQNQPLPTPSVNSSPIAAMSPTGGVPFSPPKPDQLGVKPTTPQQTGSGFDFLFHHPGDFAAETGLTQASQDFGTKAQNLMNQLGGAKDLAGQDLANDLTSSGLVKDPHQARQLAKIPTDPVGYMNDVVNAAFVGPAQLVANPEIWFTPDESGKNWTFENVLKPLAKTFGQDIPDPTTYYQSKAQNLQDMQTRLQKAQEYLQGNPNATQQEIDAYNAQYQSYLTQYNKYFSDYQASQNWWQNSELAHAMQVFGAISTAPTQFAAGAATFVPDLIANPEGTAEGMVGQVYQAADFVGKIKDGQWNDMTVPEKVANFENLVMLAGMLHGGVHGVKSLMGAKEPGAIDRGDTIKALQENAPEIANPDLGPVDKAQTLQQTRETSGIKESPQESKTHIADLQRGLAEAQRQLQNETDPVMKKTLIEQVSGISDEIRNLQNQPRQASPVDDIVWEQTKRDLGLNIPDMTEEEALKAIYGESNVVPMSRIRFDSADLASINLKNTIGDWYKQQLSGALGEQQASLLYRSLTTMSDDDLSTVADVVRDYLQEGPNDIIRSRAADFLNEIFDEMERRKQGPQFHQISDSAMQGIARAKAEIEVTRAAINEKLKELGPSKIAPEVQPTSVYPDYFGESKQVLGPNYHFLEPRPEDFSMNATPTGLDVTHFEDLHPAEIKALLNSDEITSHDTDVSFINKGTKLTGNGWILPDGSGIKLADGDLSAHSDFMEILRRPGDVREEGEILQALLDKGWVKVTSQYGDLSFAVKQVNASNGKMIVDTILNDLKKSPGGRRDFQGRSLPYIIAEQVTRPEDALAAGTFKGMRVTPVTKEELAANGFDLQKTIFSNNQVKLPTQGEQLGTQISGEAGQTGAPSTTSEGRNRPEGTPEGTTLASVIEGKQSQAPVAVWEANPQSAGALSGGERTAQLIAKQDLIQSAINAASRIENTTLRRILQRGLQQEIDKIPIEQMSQYVADRKKTIENTFARVRQKYDPEGYVQHIVWHDGAADAFFSPDIPRTITFNPLKMMAGNWSRYMARYFNESAIEIKDLLGAKEYLEAKNYLDQWANATQDLVDERIIAEEFAHAYDYDHPGISGKDFRQYLGQVMANSSFVRAAYDSGFGPAEGELFDKSLMGIASRYLTDPSSVKQEEINHLFTAVTEYRANLLLNYFKAPLAGYSFRVPEVFRNEIRNPALREAAVRAIAQDYEARIKPAIRSWVSSQRPSGAAFPASPAVEGRFAQANAESGIRPTGAAIPGESALQSTGVSGRDAGDQGSYTLNAKGPDQPTEREALDKLQPRPEVKPGTEAVLQRTVMHQALTDLKAAGWPEGKRWELFARALNADPDSAEATEAYKILDSLPPKSQEIFMKAADKIEPLDLQGQAMPIAQGQEATQEVPSPATRNQIESPQFQYVQKELAGVQLKIEAAGPRIAQMEASGASLKDINNEKAGLADLMAYRDALQNGETPLRAAALGRSAYTKTLLDFEARSKEPITRIPELENEQAYGDVYVGNKYSNVEPNMANFLVKRLGVLGYDVPISSKPGVGKGITKEKVARLDDFFDGLFAEDREAYKVYKKLNDSTKDYLRAKIGYRGTPPRGMKAAPREVGSGQPIQEVAPGTENYINQTDLKGIENVIDMVHQSTGGKGGFIVIRHGSTARNGGAGAAERMRGWDDIPLNDQGEQQADRLGAAFAGKKIAIIYASPMKRSLDTANAISKTTGAKVVVDDNLKPWNIGEYSGKDAKVYGPELARLAKEHPDQKIPGGESFNDYLKRYIPAVQKHMQDAIGLDGMTLEVNHTRGYRMVKSLIQSKGDPSLPIRDAVLDKSEIGPGGLMGLRNVNGFWQVAGDYVSDPLDPTKKTWVNGEASQAFDVPEGEKAVPTAAKEQPAPKSIKEVYDAVDPMTASVKKNLKSQKVAEDKAAKIKGEISPIRDINTQIDNISADPTHPANASAVEAKVLRDMLPAAQDLGGAAYDRIKSDYAAALQRFTTRMTQIAKQKPKAAEAAAPVVPDKTLFDKTTKLAEGFRKRIDAGEDPDAVAKDAAKAMGMTLKKAVSKLHDANWSVGEGKSWAPAMKDILMGKAAAKVRANRLANKPGRKTVPFELDDVITHEPKLVNSDPKAPAPQSERRLKIPAIAKTLRRNQPTIGKEEPPQKIVGEARKESAQKISDAAKKTTKQLREESEEINKQINTPSPNPFAGNLFSGTKKVDLVAHRKERRRAGLEEPGMRDGDGGKGTPPPPDGPGNLLAGWDDARDPLRSFGGAHAKLAEVMDVLVKHYVESHDPGRNQLHHLEQARLKIKQKDADHHLMREAIRAMQQVLPDFKKDPQTHYQISDAIEEESDGKRAELKKELTPEQAAFVDMYRSWEQIKGKVKTDNDLLKADIENYLAHVMKFDENGKALLDKGGRLRSSGLSGRLAWWRERAVDPETGETRYPTLRSLRDEFGANNVEGDLTKIFFHENTSFSSRLRYHQLIQDLTQHLVQSGESQGLKIRPARGVRNLTSGKDVLNYEGHPIVPASQLEHVPSRYRDQLDTVNIGPAKSALSQYRVYKPLKELLERQADIEEDMNGFNMIASAPLRWANNLFKLYKFVFNPLHMYNVTSDIDMYLSKSSVPMSGVPAMYKRVFDLKAGRKAWDTPLGKLDWNQALAIMVDNGATIREKLIDTANLGALQGKIANPVKLFGHDVNVFNRFHDLMWVDGVWQGHIGLTMHLADYYAKKMEEANNGTPVNAAQFNHAIRLAALQSNKAVGFLDRMDMSRNWRMIGETVNFANAWSTLQFRNLGTGLKGVPGAKALQNWGGGERYLDTLTKILPEGGLTADDMNLMNSVNGKIGRRFVVNGTLKLLAASTIMGYMGSYIAVLTGQPGAQLTGPWQNFQKDPTHTFDIFGGIDPQTGKQIWYHNPLYNALSELIDYNMGAVKAQRQGEDLGSILTNPLERYASGKANPFIGQFVAMMTGQELNRMMAGYKDPSIHADPSIVAIENALSAHGINLPVGLEDRLIYAIREVGPVPGFAPTYGKDQAINTPGDILNAVGPGKYLGIGDFMNAVQSGDYMKLIPGDIGNLAMFLLGSRQTETATPDQLANDNQISQSIAQQDQKKSVEQQMLDAAYKHDYKTVAALSNQLGYDNNQMVNALEHPPSGMGGGIIYNGQPYQAPATSNTQDTLQGYTLTPGQTAELEALKKANFLAMYNEIIATPEWQASDNSNKAAFLDSMNSQLMKVVEDQYAQNIGIMGGAPITNADIQSMISRTVDYRNIVAGTLQTSDAYVNASDLERARMMKEYKTFADNIAYKAEFGAYKGVPPERIQGVINDTIVMEEQTRQYLQGSVFYQMADQQSQVRMLSEYGTLARTISEKFALGQGMGPRGNITLSPEQVPMVIEKTIQVEETAKAMLHSTDYYQTSDLATQQSLDSKYETLARSLAFSPEAYVGDPGVIVRNSIMSEEAYFALQNQFGGGNYLKLMAQQLSDMELTLRQNAPETPATIARMQRALRENFLANNPVYANYLKVKTAWQKTNPYGQMYKSLNNAEYAAQEDLAQADQLSDSVLTSGTSSDPYFDPASNMGLADLGTDQLGAVASAFDPTQLDDTSQYDPTQAGI